jgi:hypothetical protein
MWTWLELDSSPGREVLSAEIQRFGRFIKELVPARDPLGRGKGYGVYPLSVPDRS